MPRNNGIYTPPPSTWNPAIDGQPADPESWNDLLADISAALSQSVSKDGQTQITGDMNWGGNKITNLGLPAAPGDSLRYGMITKGSDIASAATINIPIDGIVFEVTGGSDISAITGGFSGKFAFLRFSSELTIHHSSNLILPGNADYRTSPDEMVLVVRIGTAWQMFASGSAYQIGDFLDTLRTMDDKWLRRNGALYNVSDYPDLAAVSPPLPDDLLLSTVHTGAGNVRAIIKGPDKLVAVASNGLVSISTDGGESWITNSSGVPALGAGVYGSGSNSCYGLGVYLSATLTRDIAVSLDGENWSNTQVFPAGVTSTAVYFNGIYLFAVGNAGNNSQLYVYRSQNGVDWEDVSPSGAGTPVPWMCHNGSQLLMFSNGAYRISQNNGSTWSAYSPVVSPATMSCIWTGSKYMAVGIIGRVTDSTNGEVWNNRSSGTTTDMYSVARSSAAAVMVGASGSIRFSTNEGFSWAGVASGQSTSFRSVIVPDEDNPYEFLIAGENGVILRALKTAQTQFRVPNDNPQYGWIKAL